MTVNVTGLLVPPGSVTVIFRAPSALLPGALASVNVAVAVVVLVTTILLTAIPLGALIVIGALKFVPVSVTESAFPGLPEDGLMLLRVVIASTVKVI